MVRLTFPSGCPVPLPVSRAPIGRAGTSGKVRRPEFPIPGSFGNFGKASRLPCLGRWPQVRCA